MPDTALDERGWDLVIADHSMPAFGSPVALGVHSRLQALLFAARHGLIELR